MAYFKAKMHKTEFGFGWGSRPQWGSLQHSSRPLAGFKGPTSKQRGGEETGRKDKRRRGHALIFFKNISPWPGANSFKSRLHQI